MKKTKRQNENYIVKEKDIGFDKNKNKKNEEKK
jgi:hypothetical protein